MLFKHGTKMESIKKKCWLMGSSRLQTFVFKRYSLEEVSYRQGECICKVALSN